MAGRKSQEANALSLVLATCFPCELPIGAEVKKIRVGRNQLQVLRQHPTLYDPELSTEIPVAIRETTM